nr:hypothetical protein BSM_09400 [uncultured archaeon]
MEVLYEYSHFPPFCFIDLIILYKFTSFQRRGSEFHITSEFNEVTTEGSDLGGANCKFAQPLNSCYVLR